MSREDEIKSIAYDIWEKEGRKNGHDVEYWLKAQALWDEKKRRRQILSLVMTAFFLALMPLLEWKLGAYQRLYGIVPGTVFAMVMALWFLELRLKREIKLWRQFLYLAMIALYFLLLLDYEKKSGTFQQSHNVFLGVVYCLIIIFTLLPNLWVSLRDFIGLEEAFSSNMMVRLYVGMIGAVLISLYLLLGSQSNLIPPVLQFGIVPVTATLGGLVVAGSNYSKISPERRAELLKVSQKLIVATIAFIFFASMLFLAGDIKPNVTPSTQLEWTKYVFFWLATFLFYSGVSLFVIGIIDLAISLKNLKKE